MSIFIARAKAASALLPVVPYGLLASAVFAAYANIFGNDFLYDDNLLIELNSYLRGWNHVGDLLTGSTTSGAHIAGGFYRPLQMLLYLISFHLGDGSAFWFHLLNLSLHAANSCLVYRLGTKLGFKPWGVFAAALIWGLHPLQTEAVTYMSATADPLSAFFCLGALSILAPDFKTDRILKAIPLFLLALASKESAAVFPFLVVTCLFLTSPSPLSLRSYYRTWPFWVISFCYTMWRLHTDAFFGPHSAIALSAPNHDLIQNYSDHFSYRFYTFLATLPTYLSLMLWPATLYMNHDFLIYANLWDKPVLKGCIVILLASAATICKQQTSKGRALSWGFLWFLSAHLLDSGLVVPVDSVFFEHWMYLPTAGLFLGITETVAEFTATLPRISYACFSGAMLFAALMSLKTHAQNEVWRNPVNFYGNIIRYSHKPAIAYSNLGNFYLKSGEYNSAIQNYSQAIAISDSFAATRFNLAYAYMLGADWKDHAQDAIVNLRRSLELDPGYYRSCELLADIYNDLGDTKMAGHYHDMAGQIRTRQK